MSQAPSTIDPNKVANRPLIVLSIMTATIMNSLDTTIANVALPHIQGSVSASSDQITWVLTSYIVAAAIMTPMTGWLAGRYGRKIVFMISIAGFTFASALCGIAGSLAEIVGFRLLQGVCGAALIPLSQAVLLDIYPRERHGQAMAVWGMGAMLGPIMGPALGGWLTENYSWRWVFYINLPFGVLAFLGFFLFLHETRQTTHRKLDFVGFLTLSLGIGALQLFLDRGQQKDWFSSPEIWVEAILALLGFYWAVVQTLGTAHPFISREVLRNKNFLTCTIVGFFINILLFATLALLPPMLEDLLGYPVVTTGLVTAPRGFGTLFSMFIVGRLIGRVDTRLIILTGLGLTAASLWQMTHVNLQMDANLVVFAGLSQGFGVGLVFVPLSTVVFSTLDTRLRTEAAGLYTLVRNIGSSVGISVLQSILTQKTQTVHADLVRHIRPDNPSFRAFAPPGWSLSSLHGIAVIDAEVTRQAAMIGYADCFKFMLTIAFVAMPMVLLMRPPRQAPAKGEVHAVE
ncbi:MAG: MDR family MFS transporter [Caulobacteraceae bacterium]